MIVQPLHKCALLTLLLGQLCACTATEAENSNMVPLTASECKELKVYFEEKAFVYERYSEIQNTQGHIRPTWKVELGNAALLVPAAQYETYEFTKSANSVRLMLRDKDHALFTVIISEIAESAKSIDFGRQFEVTPHDLECIDSSLGSDLTIIELLRRKAAMEPPRYPDQTLRILDLPSSVFDGYAVHGPGSKPETYLWQAEAVSQGHLVSWIFRYDVHSGVPIIDAGLETQRSSAAPRWWSALDELVEAADIVPPDRPYVGSVNEL